VPVAPAALRLVLPAEPSSLAGMRRRLGRWLDELGATPLERAEIQMASHEACCNSMEHGYAFGDETLELEAEPQNGGVTIVVSDRGGWREPREGGDRGRGLAMMRELMSDVELDPSAAGTRVAMRRRLERLG